LIHSILNLNLGLGFLNFLNLNFLCGFYEAAEKTRERIQFKIEPMTTARDFALLELDERELPGWESGLIRGRKLGTPSDPRDIALGDQIVFGVTKNLLFLQHLIEHFSGRSLSKVDPLVQKILAVGLYQLSFLDRVPASAAVDQAVEQARRFGRKSAAGFVNAVLRNACRGPAMELPDSARDPRLFAEVALSHPPDLFARLRDLLGDDRALQFCRHDNSEPPTIVRLFDGIDGVALQTDDAAMRTEAPVRNADAPARNADVPARNAEAPTNADASAKAARVEILPHEQARMFVVRHARRSLLEDWAARGIAQPQDATAAGVIEHLDLQPGQRVLDRCAGLGTKTLQIQQRVGASGSVTAVDPSGPRCAGLRQLLRRRGIGNVAVFQAGWMKEIEPASRAQFDRILLDVPCSNSGVLARRAEARYHQDKASLESLRRLQLNIFEDSAPLLSIGGLLLYSTCSVWPEENEGIVREFLANHAEFESVGEQAIWPSFGTTDPAKYHDGGYWAAIRRKV
jgi:16S rRNA (cytosine967-C5)-methyltransferase